MKNTIEIRRFAIMSLNNVGIYTYKGKKLSYLKSKGTDGLNCLYKQTFNKNVNTAYLYNRLQENTLKNGENDFVYVFANIKYGFCKIGYSTNPFKRLKEVQTGCPFPLMIIAKYKGNRTMETLLHRKYKSYKVRNRGEWFYFKGNLKDSILKSNNCLI